MRHEVLAAGGIDVDDALGRLMGNEKLLARLLGKFLDDTSYQRFLDAVAADDAEAGLEAAHALKGVSGNLSMVRVHELTTRACELIRAGDWPAARGLADELGSAYSSVKAAIEACEL